MTSPDVNQNERFSGDSYCGESGDSFDSNPDLIKKNIREGNTVQQPPFVDLRLLFQAFNHKDKDAYRDSDVFRISSFKLSFKLHYGLATVLL